MKKILYPVFFTLFALIASSCDNEPLEGEFGDLNGGNGGGSNGGSFVATIDGNSFIADQAQAVFAAGTTLIKGTAASGESISITFSGSETGTYDLNTSTFASYFGSGSTNPYTTNASANGSLSISEVTDSSISGTFSFKAQRIVTGEDGTEETQIVEVTEGSFTNISFSGATGGGSGETEYYINFSIGEEEFSYEAYTADSEMRLVRGGNDEVNNIKMISLWMPLNIIEGTYDITDAPPSDTDAYTAEYDSDPDNINLDATEGTLTIISVTDNTIEGTFSFSGDDGNGNQISITNGEFLAPVP